MNLRQHSDRSSRQPRFALLLATAIALAGLGAALPARADYYDGLMAYQGQDYPTAFRELAPLADAGDPRSQKLVGLMYRDGQGVPQDFVRAHQWLNLAAASGDGEAASARDELAQRMERGQIAEAQRLAAGWQPGSATAPTAAPTASTAGLSEVPPKTPAVDARPLDHAMVSDMQWQLAVHGYEPGSPDGRVGPRTRAAIRQYQADAGLPVDGEPSGALLSHLQYSHPPVLNPRNTATASAMPPAGAEPGYGNYPPDSGAGYPPDSGGGYAAGYEGPPDYQGMPPRDDLMRIYTVTVQQALAAKGYEPGPPDGVLGWRTRDAIRRYQRGYNLPVTGEVSLDLVNHLRLVSSYPAGYGPTAAQPYEPYPPDQTY